MPLQLDEDVDEEEVLSSLSTACGNIFLQALLPQRAGSSSFYASFVEILQNPVTEDGEVQRQSKTGKSFLRDARRLRVCPAGTFSCLQLASSSVSSAI